MRRVDALPGPFDALLLLWQSFGQFDDAANLNVLRQIAGQLAPGGRFLLDIYHRGFFQQRLGTRIHEKCGVIITESKRIIGQRLVVDLEYDHGHRTRDRFEWRLYEPDEITDLARSVGLHRIRCCTEFDASLPPTSERPRMQFIFEKPLT